MSQDRIARNKVVFFNYLIKDEQGRTLERNDLPIGYVHGCGSHLIAKVERALEGHAPGDLVTVPVSPAEGFGERDPDLTYTDDLANVPPALRMIGAEAEMRNERGEVRHFQVTRIHDGKLTLDGNHPFAGRHIVYQVSVTEVRDANRREIANGCPDAESAPRLH